MENNGNNNNGNRNGSGNGNGSGRPPKGSLFGFLVVALLTLLFINLMFRPFTKSSTQEIPYSEFVQMIEDGKADKVVIGDSQVTITLKKAEEEQKTDGESTGLFSYGMTGTPAESYYAGKAEDNDTLSQRLLKYHVEFSYEEESSGFWLSLILQIVLPILLMVLLFSFLFRKMGGSGGPMGVGKSNAKVYVQKETGVTFKDVAGEDEAKESLVEVVDFLHNPGRYVKIGAKLPKGALLVGPPGTGKTLLARAVAGEAHVPFFSLTGSDFIELYVGVGASRVRDLFKEATKNAPCIVFIDEIDAIGRSRDSKYGGGNEEREQTLNQLLSEMDGFDSSKGILILAATNRPEILDKALLRPGRFDRRIIVDKPDLKGRVEILKVHSKDVLMDDSVDLDAIALATSGAVGSDLANMINEGAINAVKEGRSAVCQKDLFEAVEQVLVGKEKKDRIMSKEERKIVAYHEVGHALISALQKNSEPVQKITIVPRTMGALGYVMQVPEEEKYLDSEPELRARLVSLVGGRAAEEVVFGTVTTGAANDIEQATNIARSMITRFGMSKKFGMIGLESVESQYLDGRTVMNCSDKTASEVDEEVIKLLKESYKEAKQLLKGNRKLMDQLAAYLIEKETITGKEFMQIYRREKGLPEPAEKEKEEKTKPVKEAAPAAETSTEETAAGAGEPAQTLSKSAEPVSGAGEPAQTLSKSAEPVSEAGEPVQALPKEAEPASEPAEERPAEQKEPSPGRVKTPSTEPEPLPRDPRRMSFEEAAAAYAPQAFVKSQSPQDAQTQPQSPEPVQPETAEQTETPQPSPEKPSLVPATEAMSQNEFAPSSENAPTQQRDNKEQPDITQKATATPSSETGVFSGAQLPATKKEPPRETESEK